MNKGWTKNNINRLLVKFRTVDRCLGSGRRSARADENVRTVELLLLSQEDKPQSQEKFHVRRGDPSIHDLRRLFTKFCVSSATKRCAQQLTEAQSMHAYALFSVCSLRDDNVITSKPI